ncbi:MAG TPA: alpha/beta hydrolase [Solirubrobacteraceae bacterium]|nr:alpha/beta hydrolase [Solirubrobacteraceae bacterium]
MSIMTVEGSATEGASADWAPPPVWRELRYSAELLRLLSDSRLRAPRRCVDGSPVLLIPGFMAGDASLAVMRRWLRRRGHEVATSGILANVDCAGRALGRLEERLERFAEGCGRAVTLVGQSRGGTFARALAVRRPDLVSALVMLGSPVRDGLAVSAPVLRTVRWVAWLGDRGLPGVLSTECGEGDCCAGFQTDLTAPLAPSVSALSMYSRSDGIVDWRTCVDTHAPSVEIDSSHCGMSVHPAVYRELEQMLDAPALERIAA